MRLAVLKVGGSVITVKSRNFTVNRRNMDRVAGELSKLYGEGWRLVVVHGGGSFGHPVAAAYSLSSGGLEGRKLIGFAETRYWMSVLNLRFTRRLLEAGLPASPLQTSAVAVNRDGRLCSVDTGVVLGFVRRGIVPVLYGDAVVDTLRGASILSGDDLAARLSVELGAEALVFVMGAGGIYDKPPGVPGARLLEEVGPGTEIVYGETRGVDVTEGVRRKLSAALLAARSGVRVAIGGVASIVDMVEGRGGGYTRVIWR